MLALGMTFIALDLGPLVVLFSDNHFSPRRCLSHERETRTKLG